MSVYLGIDIGTQSVKALCYDASLRRPLAVTTAALDMISASDGTREQLAQWWVTALGQCLAEIDPQIKGAITAIGVSGQQHGFVPLSVEGDVLAPVKLWCDTSTQTQCQQITDTFGGEARCLEDVGNAILPGYTAPKIRWLKHHRPDDYRRLATILLPHDYLNYYLTGELAMEFGDASGTGLLDIRRRCWHYERDLSKCLPPLVAADSAVGQLRPAVAAELALPAGIPVSSGGGDNMMAAIGTGNVVPGRLTVSLGTSGTLFAYADNPVIDEQGALAAFCSSTGGWLPLLCTMNCTVSTELTRGLFDIPIDEFERRVTAVPAGANGIVTVPFFNGERAPNLPNAKASLFGLDAANYTADNLLRAAMESSVYGLRAGLDPFRQQGCDFTSVRLTGGGARSAVWRQVVANVFNLPVSVQQVDEGAALGAALQAMWMHQPSPLVDLVDEHLPLDTDHTRQPEQAEVDLYNQHYEQYRRHVGAVSALYR